MADRTFRVHNGLTVGALSIDATTGNIVTSGNVTANNITISSSTSFGGPSGALVISTSGTADSLRITQTGTGNVLVVEDSANPDSTPFVIDNSGNVIIGTTARSASGAILTVDSGTNDIVATFKSTDANAWVSFSDNTTGSDSNVRIGAVAADFTISTTAAERVRVHSTGNVRILATTAASSSTTGALIVAGGIGAAGNVYAGGIVDITSTTESASVSTGALIVDGGAGIAKNIFAGGNVSIASTVQSTSTTTGALVVSGGVGIAGNVTIGGNLNVLGNVTTFNSNTITIQDSMIFIARNNIGDVLDVGIYGSFTNPTFQHTGLVRDATDGIWKLFANVAAEPTTTVDFTSAIYSQLQLGNLIAVSGAASTSTSTGALRVTGGIGASGNVTAGNVTATIVAATNLTGSLTTAAQGNITSVGTLTSLTVSGAITVNSGNNATAIVNGGTSGTGNIGASGATFNTVFAQATTAQYADLAEIYASDAEYVPGTVVSFGGDYEVIISTASHDPSVAGVVSTNPGFLMNEAATGVAVALQGRVPCRVQGPVNKGDRVASSDLPGVAQRLDMSKYQPGCIIGKSLESIETNEIKTIEVVVGRN